MFEIENNLFWTDGGIKKIIKLEHKTALTRNPIFRYQFTGRKAEERKQETCRRGEVTSKERRRLKGPKVKKLASSGVYVHGLDKVFARMKELSPDFRALNDGPAKVLGLTPVRI